jgi:hypothetical protein
MQRNSMYLLVSNPNRKLADTPAKVCCLVLGTDWGCYTKQGSEGWARDNVCTCMALSLSFLCADGEIGA